MNLVPCPNCGRPLEPDAPVCPTCGTPRAPEGSRPVVKNWLPEAILATACCCLPIGLISLIFATQVNTRLDMGDIAGAQEKARWAKIFFWIALVFAVVAYVAMMGFIGFMAWSDPTLFTT